MFADETFANHFGSPKIRCKPRTVERDLQRILRFSYVYPKFHLSFS